MADDFLWRAHYRDGTTLDELDAQGQPQPFAAVDLARLAALELVPQQPHLGSHVVALGAGVRPIFFRRRSNTVNPQTEETIGTSTITCLGWQKTERGRNVQAFTFYFADGSSVVTDDRNAV